MPVQILTIARNAFIESIRQPIFFVLVMLGAFFQVLSTWTTAFSMGYGDSAEVSGDNKFLLDIGLGTVFVFGTLLAAFMATAVISREIERKTVLTVVSKPVPRPALVLGKFAGVSGAILLGVTVMLVALLLGIRHGVMSTAADDLDGPVLVFGLSALGLSLAVGLWGNFMYGWHFSQTAMVTLAPLAVGAYVLVLAVDKHWDLQPLTKDLKPQILTACACLTLGVLVLTSAAIAVSTRLSQVMTIVVCCGLLVFGLGSNYLFGRHAFHNEALGVVQTSEPLTADDEGFDTPGATYALVLQTPPRQAVVPGAPLHYGPSPSGFPFDSPSYTPFRGDPGSDAEVHSADPALIIAQASGRRLTVRNIGRDPVPVPRPPQPGDYVFARETGVHPVYLALWGVVPNMQHFWLLDAVAQNRLVPAGHVAMIALYSAAQVGVFLALGVILFQKRDVG